MLAVNALALLSVAGYASATSFSLGATINFGCSASLKSLASTLEKSECSESGSFLTEWQSTAICSSSETRVTPSTLTCPLNWYQHKTKSACLPTTEVSKCDCGEGYSFDSTNKKCSEPTGKCSSDSWWHIRSSTCCETSWETSPPEGTCPTGVSCPTDWFYHKTEKKCFPLTPRSPEPDCDDWDNSKQCCGSSSGATPSSGTKSRRNQRRSFQAREQTALFPQSALDKMYCPAGLHACTVNTASGGEWSYECVDVASEIDSCGGCVSSGLGQDCTTISSALSVGCELGKCVVYSCKSGYAINGTECVSA